MDVHELNKLLISCCDIMIYNKKNIFGLFPPSWQRAPKILGFSHEENEKGVFCYVNEVGFRLNP